MHVYIEICCHWPLCLQNPVLGTGILTVCWGTMIYRFQNISVWILVRITALKRMAVLQLYMGVLVLYLSIVTLNLKLCNVFFFERILLTLAKQCKLCFPWSDSTIQGWSRSPGMYDILTYNIFLIWKRIKWLLLCKDKCFQLSFYL